ncbi:hypothetical protein H0H92_009038, partial [Tricholoma furcatifolium]
MFETASIGSKNDKMTALKLYREKNWDLGLKDEFQGEWNDFKQANEGTSDSGRLKYYNQFIKCKFGELSEEHIAELTSEAATWNKEHEKAKRGKAPQTPQEFKEAMDNAGKTLCPMADAISQNLGTVVFIMCCGVNSDGQIEVHNISDDESIATAAPKAHPTESSSSNLTEPSASTPTPTLQTDANGVVTCEVDPNTKIEAIIEVDMADSGGNEGVNERVTTSSSTYAATAPSSPSAPPSTTSSTIISLPAATSTSSTMPESSEGIVSGVTVEEVAVPPAPPSAERTATPLPMDGSPSSTDGSPSPTTPEAIGGQVGSLEKEVGDVVDEDVVAASAAKAVPIDLASRAVVRPAPRPVVSKQVQDEPTQSVIPPTSPTKDLKVLIPIDNVGMRSAIEYLSSKAWGEDWANCIEALVDFERAKEFPRDDGRLSTSERPASISAWMRGGRRWTDIEVDAGFAGAWSAWWRTLKEDLSKISKGGANGMVVVVIGLAWWGHQAEEVGRKYKGEDGWGWAVRDVGSILKVMSDDLTSNDGGEGDQSGEDEGKGPDSEPEAAKSTRAAQQKKRKTSDENEQGTANDTIEKSNVRK